MRHTLPCSVPTHPPRPVDRFGKSLEHRARDLFRSNVPATSPEAAGGMPQFSGVEFLARSITLDNEAEENDAAVRASLIYFKHRFPGQLAEISGSEAFRLKVWALADELGVPLKGPRPGSAGMALGEPAPPKRAPL